MQQHQGFNIVEKLLNMTLFGSEWVLWLLIVASIVSVAIILERIVFFLRIRDQFSSFSAGLIEKLAAKDYEGAQKLCENTRVFESQVALEGFKIRKLGAKNMEEAMESYILSQRKVLDRGQMILGTLGNNAPFIGLFGTVLGIIKAFHDLGANPQGGMSVVMAGISEALVATAVGLLVAIPAVIAYNAFSRAIKNRLANAHAVIKLLMTYSER